MTNTVTKGRILRNDLYLWDGTDKTANRKDSTGGTISGLRIGLTVDVLQAYGKGTEYTRDTINKALASIGSGFVTLAFNPGIWTIDANLTIPSNFSCYIPAGVTFDVSSGVTLTFSGTTIRDNNTWKSGSGTVVENGTNYIGNNLSVANNLSVTNDASITNDLTVVNDATINNDLLVSSTSQLVGSITAQSGINGAAASGTDTYVATLSPIIVTLQTRATYYIYFANANTSTTPTLNINSLGAKTIVAIDGSAVGSGQIDGYHILQYDGTNLRLLNPAKNKFRGATVYNSSSTTVLDETETILLFDSETRDTDDLHSTVSNTSRLTIPSGVTKVKLSTQMSIFDADLNTVTTLTVQIHKNGSSSYAGRGIYASSQAHAGTLWYGRVETDLLDVVAGDYFEVAVTVNTSGGASIDFQGTAGVAWFAIEIIE